jgi:hypothetical protein
MGGEGRESSAPSQNGGVPGSGIYLVSSRVGCGLCVVFSSYLLFCVFLLGVPCPKGGGVEGGGPAPNPPPSFVGEEPETRLLDGGILLPNRGQTMFSTMLEFCQGLNDVVQHPIRYNNARLSRAPSPMKLEADHP